MHRPLPALAMAALGLLVVAGTRRAAQQAPARPIKVRVILPLDDAKLALDGVAVPGQGQVRQLKAKLAPGKDAFTIRAVLHPNNYTRITRQRRVRPGDREEVVVDLRKADPKEPDDIVVRYVPTPQDVTEAMCKLAQVGPDDVVYDLGCGDGRMVITAVEQFKAKRGVGVDLDPERVKDSRENARKHGVGNKVEFRQGDVLKIKDLPDATVVLLYMGDDINLRLRPILKERLKPGARVVSHRFTMGDWKPLRTERINSSAGYPCDIHLWIIGKDAKDAVGP